jgi:hypothetical protein
MYTTRFKFQISYAPFLSCVLRSPMSIFRYRCSHNKTVQQYTYNSNSNNHAFHTPHRKSAYLSLLEQQLTL